VCVSPSRGQRRLIVDQRGETDECKQHATLHRPNVKRQETQRQHVRRREDGAVCLDFQLRGQFFEFSEPHRVNECNRDLSPTETVSGPSCRPHFSGADQPFSNARWNFISPLGNTTLELGSSSFALPNPRGVPLSPREPQLRRSRCGPNYCRRNKPFRYSAARHYRC
jgi:hypothetical protein